MRNCLILGSGRSGTSMVAGTLANAGYFMGDHLYPPRHSNPKGFFEDPEINSINEALLTQVLPKRPPLLGRWFFYDRPRRGQFWLACIPLSTEIPLTSTLAKRIQAVTSKEPYCFKDPRFSYTLPVWKHFLNNVVYVCVFRHPSSTATSILKECQSIPYLRDMSITLDKALEVWTLMYRHILEIHYRDGEWLFLHFDQLIADEGLDRLEALTGAPVDRNFPDPSLRRTFSSFPVPDEIQNIYKQLCDLAIYNDQSI